MVHGCSYVYKKPKFEKFMTVIRISAAVLSYVVKFIKRKTLF